MPKERKPNKEAKKPSTMTLKERRAAKQAKRSAAKLRHS